MIDRTIRTSVSSFCLAAALALGYSGGAQATPWLNGDETTYTQAFWTVPPASTLLANNYNSLYGGTGGIFEVGIPGSLGLSILFTNSFNLEDYLPAVGPAGVLISDVVNPTSTPSGSFGGEVVALRLNIDLSDAGLLPDAAGVPFGNLLLESSLPNLNGLTVRQVLGDAAICLGGGACIDSVTDLSMIAANLNASFASGNVSDFAQQHLAVPTVSQVPEPSSLLLFASSLLMLGSMRRFRRQR